MRIPIKNFLEKVKLMKLFYFLDFTHVKKYGMPVTFDNYVNLEHGPIPSTIKNLVDLACDDADNSVLADVIYCERSEESMINRILPKEIFQKTIKIFFKIRIRCFGSCMYAIWSEKYKIY